MLATALLTALVAASAVQASPIATTKATGLKSPMYSEAWLEEATAAFLADPNHPRHSTTHAEHLKLTAGFTCTAQKFSCTPQRLAPGVTYVSPSDVRHVRPADVQTVLAIGDSITAGFGMNSGYLPFTSITEYRGDVFDIGADNGQSTIANFLKTYNSGVSGGSVGTTGLGGKIDVLNAAVSGAKVADLPGQVSTLAGAFNQGTYAKDGHKLLSLLIGANDVCQLCKGNAESTPAAFEGHYRDTLNAIKSNFNNVIVNAIQLFNVSQVYFPQQTSGYCGFAQGILNECPCSKTASDRASMDATVAAYNAAIAKVAAEFSGLPNFAVNVQPGIAAIDLVNNGGLNYLSKLDCFHPNLCANQNVATMLWNNMFQPAGQKAQYQFGANAFYCPGPNDYIQ